MKCFGLISFLILLLLVNSKLNNLSSNLAENNYELLGPYTYQMALPKLNDRMENLRRTDEKYIIVENPVPRPQAYPYYTYQPTVRYSPTYIPSTYSTSSPFGDGYYIAKTVNPQEEAKLDPRLNRNYNPREVFEENPIQPMKIFNSGPVSSTSSTLLPLETKGASMPSSRLFLPPRSTGLPQETLSNRFLDVINEIKALKTEIFGNPTENMELYKKNRDAYTSAAIQRAKKIAKILELEELLDFYELNNMAKDLSQEKAIPKRLDKSQPLTNKPSSKTKIEKKKTTEKEDEEHQLSENIGKIKNI